VALQDSARPSLLTVRTEGSRKINSANLRAALYGRCICVFVESLFFKQGKLSRDPSERKPSA